MVCLSKCFSRANHLPDKPCQCVHVNITYEHYNVQPNYEKAFWFFKPINAINGGDECIVGCLGQNNAFWTFQTTM